MKKVTLLVAASLVLAGCDTLSYQFNRAQRSIAESTGSGQPVKVSSEARLVTATGYAPISAQPGATPNQKMLNAMRASKLRAYQELAAIVHGQYLFGTTQVRDMVLQSDQFDSAVGGIVRGARVVKSYPVQEDTYATILELDLRDVQRAYIDMQ
ncbi:LPP20 family lipoprotein [Motiliproteus sediminis]|uniref:LPP20 family lipoprotein n=1 Tax=Motiliproteus sediminis TaxID=1468178 RepID=UPI001AEFE3E1|nr:LPP20 family lipoprotein [Motiliproteus sediminis]